MDLQARNSNVYYHEYLTYIPGTIKEGDRDEPTVHWGIFMAYRKNRRPAKNAHRRIVFPDIFWRVELFTRRATQPLRRLLFSNFGLLTELGHGTFRQFKSPLFP